MLTRLVGTELAAHGLITLVLCADPQHTTAKWAAAVTASGQSLNSKLTVATIDGDRALDLALHEAEAYDMVLIDVQGAFSATLNVAGLQPTSALPRAGRRWMTRWRPY